jgi:hypothetical protein
VLQGLNRLAAIALLFLSEEESFWCMEALVEHIMPKDYFTKTLAGAQADQVTFCFLKTNCNVRFFILKKKITTLLLLSL